MVAGTLTGNVLVQYDPAWDQERVAERLLAILEDSGAGDPAPPRIQRRGNAGLDAVPSVQPHPRAIEHCPVNDFVAGRVGRDEEHIAWHALDPASVCLRLESDPVSGLTHEAALERLQRLGPNKLPETPIRSGFAIFAGQLRSLPTALLAGAAGLSVLTGGLLDAAIITGVVLFNAIIGYVTESKAEKTLQSLTRLTPPTVKLLRESRTREISSADLAPGDVFLLEPGMFTPADARLLEAEHLMVDESALTGESMPVVKSIAVVRDARIPMADRRNMVYCGTLVTGGRGIAITVATGTATEMGQAQLLLGEAETPRSPLERQLRTIGNQLVLAGLATCVAVLCIGVMRGLGLIHMIRTAVSLAAAAVPEGLPTAATTTLALGVNRMRQHGVLVRRLHAIETLGAVQTVCFDKTGTITWNRMSVTEVYCGMRLYAIRNGRFFVQGRPVDPGEYRESSEYREFRRIVRVAVLCSGTRIRNGEGGRLELIGSSTEVALLNLADLTGVDAVGMRRTYPLSRVTERSETRLYMTAVHAKPNGRKLFSVKGSPRDVLALCGWHYKDGQKILLTEADRITILEENERMAAQALRVLGFAQSRETGPDDQEGARDLTWLGLVGMADPVREGVPELIRRFHRAGVRTVMLTGDQSTTAYTVAQFVGLAGGEPLRLVEASCLAVRKKGTPLSFDQGAHVYSRVSPGDKLKIVLALQAGGRVVAMTGDGINDGPALKAADVGIAMGKAGTDTAREVADVILENDDLEALITALKDGRTIHLNLKKSVHYALSTNLSELLLVFSALAAGLGSPLNAMQLLWINLISDIFPGLALSLEPVEPGILEHPPRNPQEPLLTGSDFRHMLRESAVMSAGALGAYGYGLLSRGPAGTLAFHTLAVSQLLHALTCRSGTPGMMLRRPKPRNRILDIAVGGSLVLHCLTVIIPAMRRLLGLAPLKLLDGLVVVGGALATLLFNRTLKGIQRTFPAQLETAQRPWQDAGAEAEESLPRFLSNGNASDKPTLYPDAAELC